MLELSRLVYVTFAVGLLINTIIVIAKGGNHDDVAEGEVNLLVETKIPRFDQMLENHNSKFVRIYSQGVDSKVSSRYYNKKNKHIV